MEKITQHPGLTAADLDQYSRISLLFSGGKDSLATALHLLELGVDPSRIEFHHHDVDGPDSTLMDWPITRSYCEKIAQALGIEIAFSWREGGFEAEMTRQDCSTRPAIVPINGVHTPIGGNGPLGTRMKFPQLSASLQTRYCSSSQKIDVGAAWFNNEPKFRSGKTLVISGERAEESANRAKYLAFEPHRCDLRNGRNYQRYIDHWRPVLYWNEQAVWDIIKRWSIKPHPCYEIGYSRASCRFCVFSDKHAWATGRAIAPDGFNKVANYEREFNVTIHRSLSVIELADAGTPFVHDPKWSIAANSRTFDLPVFVQNWTLPAGAFKHASGPT